MSYPLMYIRKEELIQSCSNRELYFADYLIASSACRKAIIHLLTSYVKEINSHSYAHFPTNTCHCLDVLDTDTSAQTYETNPIYVI